MKINRTFQENFMQCCGFNSALRLKKAKETTNYAYFKETSF